MRIDSKSFFKKTKLSIKNYGYKFMFSLGVGGLLALYIIELCRIKLITNLNWEEYFHDFIIYNNINRISYIEICILITSIISIVSAPLLSKRDSKRNFEVIFFIILSVFELICFMSMLVQQEINNMFILGTTITSIYIVWITIDILKIIYTWTKIDKSAEKQVDVSKLTFIWAIIVFIIGILR